MGGNFDNMPLSPSADFLKATGEPVQVAHGEQYLILASSTVPLSSTDAAYPRDSVVQNVPVYASTTFHLVSFPTISLTFRTQ